MRGWKLRNLFLSLKLVDISRNSFAKIFDLPGSRENPVITLLQNPWTVFYYIIFVCNLDKTSRVRVY